MKHDSFALAGLLATAFTFACGSNDASPTGAEGVGGSSSLAETGGALAATGGASSATGGTGVAPGGSGSTAGSTSATTGGTASSTGGSNAATGGNLANTGGSSAASGDVLDQLKVRKSDTPLTDTLAHHPLQHTFSTYMKRSELYLSGVSYNADSYFKNSTTVDISSASGKRQFLLDDKKAVDTTQAPKGYKPLYSSSDDQTWTTYPSASTAAKLNGDGRESVVVLHHNHTTKGTFLRVIRRAVGANPGYQEKEYELGTSYSFTPYSDYPSYDKLEVAAGDLDNDGVDELVLVIGNTLVVEKYNSKTDAFSTLDKRTFGTDAAPHLTSVAVGNVDEEPGVEIVVADGVNGSSNSCAYHIFSLVDGALQLKAGGASSVVMEAASQAGRAGFVTARVAIGDLDDDGLNEIAFAGDVENNQLVVTVMRYNADTASYDVIASTRKNLGGANWSSQYLPVVQVFSPEGVTQSTGKSAKSKALLVYRYILTLDPNKGLVDRWDNFVLGNSWYDKVTVGDFTGDGKDDIAYYSTDNSTSLQIWGYDAGTFHQIDWIDIDPTSATPNAPTLCAVDIDDDSTIVKYTQEYDMLYSQPQLLAVLAFPPYYEGQDVGNAYTSFGWEVTSESESSKTLGVYAGFSVGFSVETPFWGSGSSAELKLNVDTSLDYTTTTTNSWSGSAKKTCMGGDDGGEPCVVFSYTPIDVYYYEVVSSPDATRVGKTVSVQVPRSPRIADAVLSNYNSIVGDEFKVPASLERELTAQLGHPELYPSRVQMLGHYTSDPPPAGYRTPDTQILEVSSDSRAINEFELDTGTATGYGTEFNLQVGIEAQTVTSGVLVGGRAGFHYGYSQSETVGHNTIIAGGVPGIMSSLTGAPFNVGLFAYSQTRSDGGEYVVVNYWVEQ